MTRADDEEIFPMPPEPSLEPSVLVPRPTPATPLVPEPGRYLDHGEFAQGGSASLHLVTDTELERVLAMKIMNPHVAVTPRDKARFVREARITARLEHPGVVPVHELGDDAAGRAWFTMKRIRGRTFDKALKPGGDLRTLVDTLLRVCDTVAFAHTHGVIHRDIKPANVMVGSFGEVYLMDWGIALLPGDAPGGVEGTPSWLAPEQARGDNVDVRVDVYGVGGLLYHALCGAKPHPGGSADERLARAVRDPVIPPQAITPGLPPELCRIAMRALAFDPAERYPDVASLRADLDAALRAGWWLETCSWPAGAEIVREGDAADSAWIILEGRATVWRGGWEVTEIGPGATIGEMALLCGENRTATVTALTDVVARVIRADMLESALQDAWLGPIVRGLAARLLQRDRE